MKENIIVVGGYGHVGQTICRQLGELYPGKVYAAGRNFTRAEQFSATTGGKVKPLQMNVSDGFEPDMANRVKLVIMCLDQSDTAFVRSCFQYGIRYMDVSANHSFLAEVERLQEEACFYEVTAVLSIGLAPGLTNLLALQAKKLTDHVDTLDIAIMLGMGDQHGNAAIEWTVDNLAADFHVVKEGGEVAVQSFTDGRLTDFGAKLGYRRAYRFNFSDQHVLPRTLGVPNVSTRLCFDSAAVTGWIAGLRAVGLLRLLKLKPVRRAVVARLGKIRFGEDLYAVKIDAKGRKDHKAVYVECFLHGRNEAQATAQAAAAVAERLYGSGLPHGVYHIEQLFDLDCILHALGPEVTIETRIDGQRVLG
ncbi:saccharopine dehydrogenase family protein [Paenibacillus mendelii]|uniref:Saccharopine dehydrogenase family protein n=1 Tax=Paenibacillus mendelii TaxID=206163 RepID=A0ABV6J7W9_9BACL|nr:saccharopine dehydrogenase NADP-binding domain-containing protein [Paenibacillus mendelii]MCQ6561366.1 saccharopine dehydrogenase NADP-binding domain-containing protein [Paenibacillus mendelii]